MSTEANPVIGAVIRKDGTLQPVEGSDPSSQWTYRKPAPAVATNAPESLGDFPIVS